MVSSFRQKEILDIARKDGKVTVDGLARNIMLPFKQSEEIYLG